MKGCELCSYPARIYCEADGASLCSDCDKKVHSANFLVAKHSRSLLCHACQSPTPWKASGTKLAPTVSVCVSCVDDFRAKQGKVAERNDEEGQGGNQEDVTDDDLEGEDDYSDEDGEYGDDEDEEEEEEGDNQVVPWSSTPPLPPPVASSSTSEEVSSCRISSGVSGLKRTRETADLDSDDENGCTSSRFNHNTAAMAMTSEALENDEATSLGSRRPVKLRRSPNEVFHESESTSVAMILSSLRKLQQNTISNDNDASATILGICRLSRDPTAV